ncbi:L,D-transpeptidase [Luteolibacter sp. AS25]|uniref:L,D-transpeptidase n=1 Tax=Luteolibacter sp. AS25 TaxID=3135776 RepID=UPI00398B7F16
MKTRSFLLGIAGVFCSLVFSSCSMNKAGGGITAYQAYDRPAKLAKDPGAVQVKVSLSKQRVYVMEGGEMLLAMPVTVGESISPTPVGDFTIYKKDEKHREDIHGYASDGKSVKQTTRSGKPGGWKFKGTPMPYWCEFKPEFGFHTGWVKHTPCTNGCIRMHENLAPKFFKLVSEGTPVSISYHQDEDEKWANMALPPDAGPLADYPEEMYFGDGYFSRHITPEFD